MNIVTLRRKTGRSVRSSANRLSAGVCYAGSRIADTWAGCTGVGVRFIGALGALALMLVMAPFALATDPLLPSTGINMEGMVGEVVTSLGSLVAVIVAAWFAFLLIKKSLKWARSGF